MFDGFRDSTIYTIFFVILIILLAVLTLCVVRMSLLKKQIRELRIAAERIKKEREVREDALPSLYKEGELGKLAESIDAILREFEESEKKEKKQKEYLMDMLSDISHQLKTPLSSLTVFTDVLLNDTENAISKEKRLEILRQEETQLERMKWLIQSLLQLARIEAGAVQYEMQSVDLYEFARMIKDSFQIEAEKKNITISVEGDRGAEAAMDPNWMQEAVSNVMKNAVDYGKEGGKIVLRVSKTPIAARLIVEDDGCGIKEEDRLNIFKRFYRVDRNAVNPSSVGIGLALAKSIIEDSGGRIYVESRHESECVGEEKSYTHMVICFSD